MKLCVFSNDPIKVYVAKGEIKPRYYNPGNLFDEVHLVTLDKWDVRPEQVQILAGDARLYIHPIGRPSVWTFPLYRARAASVVKQIEPDLIRGYGQWKAGTLAVYTGRRLRIPTVISLHIESDAMRRFERHPLYQVARLLERYSIGGADRVICVSGYLVPYARRYGARETSVIYNKVYAQQFNRNGHTVKPYDPQRPTILSVSRLDPQKYQECLIRAIQGLDVRLVLIGDGKLRGYLEQLARDLKVSQRVEFIHSVPNQEIAPYYWSSDIFAMATHYEGFCIPVLEAMAAGLPVVACDTPPLPEVLGGTGIVVSKTPEAFRETFVRLLAEPQLRQQLGAKARARAVELDGSMMERKEAELYQEVIGVS